MNLELNVLKNNIYTMFIHSWKSFNEAREPFNKTGAFKKVFISKSNPDIVIKTFDESLIPYVEGEYDFYMDYPDLYAKIYKIDYNKRVIIQELLNTNRAIEDISILHIYLPTNYSNIGSFLLYMKRLVLNKDKSLIKEIENKLDSNIVKIFTKWIIFLEKILKIDPTNYNCDYLDIHYNNIGYDKKGNLKLLDI